LHGGEVPPQIDGGPDAWYTSDGNHIGGGYYSEDGISNKNYAIYTYPNTQEASPIWFHDHTLGATRLNVFSGLAGAYLIADAGLTLPAGLGQYGLDRPPSGGDELTVPLVIQDRSFDTNGQLFMPADSAGGVLWTTNPEHPYWVPEFVGDTVLVNGVVWPYMNVEPKRYRFLFLNGSNARTYSMFLTDPVSKNFGPAINIIATDGGYLDTPVQIDPAAAGLNKLTMMPGERYEAIIDFNGYEAGTIGPNGVAYSGQWLLKNNAKTPFPAGTAPQGTTTARIMLFRVGTCLSEECGASDTSYNPAGGAAIRTGADIIQRLVDPVAGTFAPGATAPTLTRQLTLNEVMGMPMNVIDPVTGVMTAYPGGPLEILVNNTKWSGERVTGVQDGMYTHDPINGATYTDGTGDYLTELPQEGDTEIWEIVNLTADAHPIHLHLVQFQLMNRQNFNVNKFNGVYNAAFTDPSGFDFTTGQSCAVGVFCPGYGPPLPYDGSDPLSGGKLGGNPDVGRLGKNGKPLYLQGMPMPPNPNEAGWKDTVITYPGQVTRIAVRWAPTSLPNTTSWENAYYPFDPSGGFDGGTVFPYGYVWHCHIIDHEDNEMMRPDAVFPNPNAIR
jgi:spore coat protein A